jgi:type IV secretory pathway VirB9-like protein
LADTVVRRGETPFPVRTPLAVQLPEPMAAQLQAAAEQAAQAQQAAQAGQEPPPAEPVARRSAQGSAMQQLRTITGG